jgi:hypothetical protein
MARVYLSLKSKAGDWAAEFIQRLDVSHKLRADPNIFSTTYGQGSPDGMAEGEFGIFGILLKASEGS